MRGLRGAIRLLTGGVIAAVILVVPLAAGAVVIDGLVTLLQAASGQGWAVHPDQTAGGTERFVEGPLTPPSGRGSLEVSVASSSDRALVFTVPKPGSGATPPGDVGSFNPTPWGNLSGSFSTFTTSATTPAASLGSLRIVGYQQFNEANPLLSTGFTALVLEPVYQPQAAAAGVWQTWTMGSTSGQLWQTNQTDGFCTPAAPCTVADFAAQYPNGRWGSIQVGLGTGVPAATSYVDNVQVSDGTTNFVYDFEVPAAASSTATITAGAATATGGSVNIALTASPVSAEGETVFTILFSGSSAVSPAPVTVAAGETQTLNFPLPFGTTDITVQSGGVDIASAPVTFTQPTTTTSTDATTTPSSTTTGATLPATGGPHTGTMIGAAAALIGLGGVLVLLSCRRVRRSANRTKRYA
jgi:hypothetical protein